MAKRLFRSDIDKEWHEIDNRNWLEDTDKEDTVITDWLMNAMTMEWLTL